MRISIVAEDIINIQEKLKVQVVSITYAPPGLNGLSIEYSDASEINCRNISAETRANTAAMATKKNINVTNTIISLLLLYEFCRCHSSPTGIPDTPAATDAITAAYLATRKVPHLSEPSFSMSQLSLLRCSSLCDPPGLLISVIPLRINGAVDMA